MGVAMPDRAQLGLRATVPAVVVLCATTILLLVPFGDKAFHIDDPLFIWVARRIESSPLDFYGFAVNWYGVEMPMSEVTKNPPLTAYYMVLAARIVGWTEPGLHLAFLLPAMAAIAGTYALARRLCTCPILAALASLSTPAFLASSTNMMSDTLLLAFWVWAVALWLRGLDRHEALPLVASAVLITLAELVKYVGVSLVPLLFAYSLVKRRRLGGWALPLGIPLVAAAAYQAATLALYGRGLFGAAAAYAVASRGGRAQMVLSSGLTTLSFAGGGLVGLAAFAPVLWSRRALFTGAAGAAFVTLLLPYAGSIGGAELNDAAGVRWAVLLQLGGCMALGVQLMALAAADLWARRDAEAVLLALWLVGVLVFAGFLNWTVNARAILPLTPAASILLVRRLELTLAPAAWARRARLWLLLVPGAAAALLVTWADHGLANSARSAASTLHAEFGRGPGTLWFQGHWGFQYYMEAGGGRAIDRQRSRLIPGDVVVVPGNNTNTFRLPAAGVSLLRVVEVPVPRALATMNAVLGAGFYSDVWGPLPFSIGPVPRERYYVFRVLADLEPR